MNISKISLFLFFFIVTPLVKAQTIVVTAQRQPDQGLIAASQQNSGPMIGGNQGGYGSAGMNDAMAARAAAEKQGCLNGVAQSFTQSCEDKASAVKQSNYQSCNKQAQYGGLIGFAGAAGVGLATALSGPVGWVVGAVSLIGGAGGTWYSFGAASCRDSADQAYEYNIKTACPNYVKNAQSIYCPK